jgi:hypothetical protein
MGECGVSGFTRASNESDDRHCSLSNLYDTFLKVKIEYEAQHNKPLKAVRLSRLTLLTIPQLLPRKNTPTFSTFYGRAN